MEGRGAGRAVSGRLPDDPPAAAEPPGPGCCRHRSRCRGLPWHGGPQPQGKLWSKWGPQAALGLCALSQAGRRGRCALVPCQTCAGPGGGPPPRWVWCLCHPVTGTSSPTASRQGLGSQWFWESESSAEPWVGISGPNCPGTQVACRTLGSAPAGGRWRGVQTLGRGRPSWMQGLWGGGSPRLGQDLRSPL